MKTSSRIAQSRHCGT